jgi:hypothetical protein
MSNSANLKLPYIAAAQAQKHVTHNEAVELLDALTQLTAVAFDTTLPPLTALDGQVWAIGSPAINAWAGRDGDLALWSNGGWVFIEPQAGWQAALGADVRVFDGTVWGPPLHQNLPGMGIRTTSDANNALAVASPATLFTHQGGGHQMKINKATATDTASLLFQTGFSGRVEMGTAGTDDFEVKTSADGITWASALTAFGATGRVQIGTGLEVQTGTPAAPAISFVGDTNTGLFQNAADTISFATGGTQRARLSATGLEVTGTLTGTAVQSSPTDTSAGRMLVVGAFGLGAGELANVNDPNTLTTSGKYRVFNAANMPTTGSFVLDHAQRFSGQAVQSCWLLFSPQRIYIRHFNSGAWTTWRIFSETIGAVTSFGGLVTGACMEPGSNANGRFERFAHGIQECWQTTLTAPNVNTAFGSRWRSADITWTYPASFMTAAIPTVVGQAVDGDCDVRVLSVTNSATVFRVVSDVSKSSAVTLHLRAKGRWADITV